MSGVLITAPLVKNQDGGLPIRVVLELVVAAESRESAEADGRREEDLRAGVHPHLGRVNTQSGARLPQ